MYENLQVTIEEARNMHRCSTNSHHLLQGNEIINLSSMSILYGGANDRELRGPA